MCYSTNSTEHPKNRRVKIDVQLTTTQSNIVRDSSAVRRLFVRLAGAVGRQSALHKENSGFAIFNIPLIFNKRKLDIKKNTTSQKNVEAYQLNKMYNF
jgi:hypothetical protein